MNLEKQNRTYVCMFNVEASVDAKRKSRNISMCIQTIHIILLLNYQTKLFNVTPKINCGKDNTVKLKLNTE